mmetsp:Transcript_35613/g.33770  ORF Transcript_35613/g.33770 Transcript_35613/m.33770 type:complete len:564 (+) Transcript_35613:289-1980(+)
MQRLLLILVNIIFVVISSYGLQQQQSKLLRPIVSRTSLKSSSSIQEGQRHTNRNEESKREKILNFLILKGEYFGGSSHWEITEIRQTKDTTCFKCTTKNADEKSVFLKYSHELVSDDIKSRNKLRYEYEGMRVFSKYSPKDVPKVILYSEADNILVSEWLEQYVPLSHFFNFTPLPDSKPVSGDGKTSTVPILDVDSDTYRAMGTIMGRCHAQTHKLMTTIDQHNHLKQLFTNEHGFSLWDRALFKPTLEKLKNPGDDKLGKILSMYNSFGCTEDECPIEGQEGPLHQAIEILRKTFLENKESLIHADLNCNNVMIFGQNDGDQSSSRKSLSFKVIDFEKCSMGPSGMDLGMFLANFLWFYAGHSEGSRRRGSVKGLIAVIDAYKCAFREQVERSVKALEQAGLTRDPNQLKDNDVERMLDQILLDAMGFMGLYSLFMALESSQSEEEVVESVISTDRFESNDYSDPSSGPNVEELSLTDMPELLWGDTNGRAESVRRRQIEMSVHAIFTYLDNVLTTRVLSYETDSQTTTQRNNQITVEQYKEIFLADDKMIAADHMTEFWY